MSLGSFVFLGRAYSTNKEYEVKKLYVGNLSFETTEAELRALFEQEGEVTSVALITDRNTGRPRGFAFVEFATEDSAQKAMQRFNDMAFGGRNLRVNEAQQRSESRSSDRRNNRY
jgi:RNA recognition motif-containing protein